METNEKIFKYRYDILNQWFDCHFANIYSQNINTMKVSISYLFEKYGFDNFMSKRLQKFIETNQDCLCFIEYNAYGHESDFMYKYKYLDKKELIEKYNHNKKSMNAQFDRYLSRF